MANFQESRLTIPRGSTSLVIPLQIEIKLVMMSEHFSLYTLYGMKTNFTKFTYFTMCKGNLCLNDKIMVNYFEENR